MDGHPATGRLGARPQTEPRLQAGSPLFRRLSRVYERGVSGSRRDSDAVRDLSEPRHFGGEPELVYHYTSSEGMSGIVESGALWATDVLFMNDTTEAVYGFKVVRDAVAEWVSALDAGDDRRQLLHAIEFVPELIPQVFVVSFSARRDDLSQWRAYCRAGGYSLGFDRTMLGAGLQVCEYDKARQREPRQARVVDTPVCQCPRPCSTGRAAPPARWVHQEPRVPRRGRVALHLPIR